MAADPEPPPARIAAIVLAAGRGTRFGAEPKMLAGWRGKPLVRHVAEAALAAGCDPVLVVTGHRGGEVAAALEGLPIVAVPNPAYADGLSTSLRAGFAALPPESEAALVALGDMPGIGAALIRQLAWAWVEAGKPPSLVPTFGGRRCNPAILSAALAPDIARLTGDVGAGPLLRGREGVVECAVDDEAVSLDIDTEEALERLVSRGPG